MIEVLLGKALICFAGQCHPILSGYQTPVGAFELVERSTVQPGYGGAVLQFAETKYMVYAIHRVYTLDRKVDRMKAIKFGEPAYRARITMGCINVEPSVYEALRAETDRRLVIRK